MGRGRVTSKETRARVLTEAQYVKVNHSMPSVRK